MIVISLENVKKTLTRVEKSDPLVKEGEEMRKVRYQGTPMAIYRHILMSEIRTATAALPPVSGWCCSHKKRRCIVNQWFNQTISAKYCFHCFYAVLSVCELFLQINLDSNKFHTTYEVYVCHAKICYVSSELILKWMSHCDSFL